MARRNPSINEEPDQPDAPLARKGEGTRRRRVTESEGNTSSSLLRSIGYALLSLLVLALLLLGANRVDELSQETPEFELRGARCVEQGMVWRVLAGESGISPLRTSLEARRTELLARIDWLEDASIQRLWPNRVVVTVRERTPVAFLPAEAARPGEPANVKVIDSTGRILTVPPGVTFQLPVFWGVRADDAEVVRRARVEAMSELLKALGDLSGPVAEVDLTNPHNAVLSYVVDHRLYWLVVGNRDYRARLERFLQYLPQIIARDPSARSFDLRYSNELVTGPGAPYAR